MTKAKLLSAHGVLRETCPLPLTALPITNAPMNVFSTFQTVCRLTVQEPQQLFPVLNVPTTYILPLTDRLVFPVKLKTAFLATLMALPKLSVANVRNSMSQTPITLSVCLSLVEI